MVVVSGNKLQGLADVPLMGTDDSINNSWAKDVPNVDSHRDSRTPAYAKLEESYRIKYHSSYSANRWMVIEGKLGSGRKYPVILDTGASVALFVNDIHIMENKLAISPINSGNDDETDFAIEVIRSVVADPIFSGDDKVLAGEGRLLALVGSWYHLQAKMAGRESVSPLTTR